MEFEEALRKASGFMKKYKGYFLCSVFSSIKNVKGKPSDCAGEWILHFSDKRKSLDCHVADDAVRVDDAQSLGEPIELDVRSVSISLDKAIESTGVILKKAVTILVSLHNSPPVWTINFIKADMTVTTFDVDAETGKITREDTTSLLR